MCGEVEEVGLRRECGLPGMMAYDGIDMVKEILCPERAWLIFVGLVLDILGARSAEEAYFAERG